MKASRSTVYYTLTINIRICHLPTSSSLILTSFPSSRKRRSSTIEALVSTLASTLLRSRWTSSRHFVGSAWLVRSREDLERASRLPGATAIKPSPAPGGGDCVDVQDPNSISIRLIRGITFRPIHALEEEKPEPVIFNAWEDRPRKGVF